jgi:MFS family permease
MIGKVTTVTNDRRRIGVLASSQLMGGIGIAAGLSVGGLLAEEISGSAAYAGLPQTAVVLGAALAAVPLARLAGRSGRRRALVSGFVIAGAGAALVFVSASIGSLPLLLLASFTTGTGAAAGLQARFAATDGVAPTRRARALSIVVWASAGGAIVGPLLIGPGARLVRNFDITALAGPWIFATVALMLSALIIWLALPSSALTIGGTGERPTIRGTLSGMMADADARLGLLAMSTGHAVMVGVMAMTSVHLVGHGSTLTFVGVVISVHVAGMFAFAPVFGWLTDRLGSARVVGVGAVALLVGACLTAYSGTLESNPTQHAQAERYATIGLFMIGLGWSAVTIAAAALIAAVSQDGTHAATDVQGTADLAMGVAGAVAGALSGVVLAMVGYTGLSLAGAALIVPLLVFLLLARRRGVIGSEERPEGSSLSRGETR